MVNKFPMKAGSFMIIGLFSAFLVINTFNLLLSYLFVQSLAYSMSTVSQNTIFAVTCVILFLVTGAIVLYIPFFRQIFLTIPADGNEENSKPQLWSVMVGMILVMLSFVTWVGVQGILPIILMEIFLSVFGGELEEGIWKVGLSVMLGLSVVTAFAAGRIISRIESD